jgi:hypothetical protein
MGHGTDQQPQQPTPAQATNAAPVVAYHWIMTVQTDDGRQGTNDGQIGALPGIHTDESTYTTVLNGMKKWMETEQVTVVFYRLVPNAISAPAVTA